MDASEVKDQLKSRIESFCVFALPGGKKKGSEWRCGSIGGEEGDSFGVHLTGDKAGIWADFAGNVSGDNLLELLIQQRSITFVEAMVVAKQWLGVSDTPIKPPRRQYAKPDESQRQPVTPEAIQYLISRGISQQIIDLYGVGSFHHSAGGPCLALPFYNLRGDNMEMLKFIGINRDPGSKKKFVMTNASPRKCLFGKNTIQKTDTSVIVCEGEIDAMSWRMLGFTALSVPFGAKHESADGSDPNDEWIENDWILLEQFEKVYLSYDGDEEGELACLSVAKRLGLHRCPIIELPEGQDCNQMLQDGRRDELKEAYAKAKCIKPDTIETPMAFYDKVFDLMLGAGQAEAEGVKLPWGNEVGGDFRLRPHEVTILTGINGSGKTQLLNDLLIHLMLDTGWTCLDFSMEVPPDKTLQSLVQNLIGEEKPANEDHLTAAMLALEEKLLVYTETGSVTPAELKSLIVYCYRRYGIRMVVIDSFMKVKGVDIGDLQSQKDFMNLLTEIVNDIPIHVIMVAHTKKMKDEQGAAGKMDVKGAGEVTDMAHNVMTITRNKAKEKKLREMERKSEGVIRIEEYDRKNRDTAVSCSKQRNGTGDEPEWFLWYEQTCKQFSASRVNPRVRVAAADGYVRSELSPNEEVDSDCPF